jgi:CcmD family protein
MRVTMLAILVLTAAVIMSSPGWAFAQPPSPSPAQEGFVPVDQLPAQEQLPAQRLVIAAYAVAWVAVFGYLWSIWRRLGRVERDILELNRRVATGGRR